MTTKFENPNEYYEQGGNTKGLMGLAEYFMQLL